MSMSSLESTACNLSGHLNSINLDDALPDII